MILIFGIIFQTAQARIIIVQPDNDLNAILINTKGGDTVLVKVQTFLIIANTSGSRIIIFMKQGMLKV